MTLRSAQTEEGPCPVPRGLEVFLIDASGEKLSLLCYEVPRDIALPALTEAEHAVLTALLEGKSNAEIASARKTALRTVANQVAGVFAKLRVRSRGELAARWGALR